MHGDASKQTQTRTHSLDEAAGVGIARDHDWRRRASPGGGSKTTKIRETLIQTGNPVR